MKQKILLLITLIASLNFLGCATTASGPSFAEAKAKEHKNGYALVYVFRKYAEPTAWGAKIHIDGKELQELNQGGFTWAYVKPGKRDITAVWSGMASQRDAQIKLNIKQNKTYYIELTGVSRADLVGGSANRNTVTTYLDVEISSGLQAIDPKYAVKKISECCKYQGSASLHY